LARRSGGGGRGCGRPGRARASGEGQCEGEERDLAATWEDGHVFLSTDHRDAPAARGVRVGAPSAAALSRSVRLRPAARPRTLARSPAEAAARATAEKAMDAPAAVPACHDTTRPP